MDHESLFENDAIHKENIVIIFLIKKRLLNHINFS